MDRYTAVRAFVRVVETGSFTKAADSLELPRNTVTKMIQSLEARLQVRLLNRTTRRVSPTNDGAAYFERMSQVMDQWQEAESDLAVAQRHPRGRLRVDMGSLTANHLVIPRLPDFHARYPDLQLDIGVSDRPIDIIGDGVDCAIRTGKLNDISLVAQHVVDLSFTLCATNEYLARNGKPKHPDDLEKGHTMVRYFFAGSGKKMPLVARCGKEQVSFQGRYSVAVNDASSLLAAGLAGLGVMRTLSLVAQPYIEDGRLVPILEKWVFEPVPVSIVFAPNRHLSARLRVFVDWIGQLLNSPAPTKRLRPKG